MKIVFIILQLLGALGLFMYGMKVMSEALQKVAGFGLRKNLSFIAGNKIKGLLSGLGLTAVIQSSSATTIMVVSFVNAGLLTIYESAGLIMGANIGTTFTVWIVALLGFKFDISTLTLPLIGIAIPFLFSKTKHLKYWSEFVIGFALIFIGLEFIKNILPDFNSNPDFLGFVPEMAGHGYISYILFFLLGLVFTSIIQSSSVTSALTLVICAKGWMGFEDAASMILGVNVGTTITANIAAIMANKPGKRAALFHTIFNMSGILWAMPLLPLITKAINSAMISLSFDSPMLNIAAIPVSLALFHSGFNVLNTLLFYQFSPQLIRITGFLIKNTEDEKDLYGLKFLSTGLVSTSELSIVQVKKEIVNYGVKTTKMFELVKKIFAETNHVNFKNLFDEIKKAEQQSDLLEEQINIYLTRLSEGELTHDSSFRVRLMLKLVDELETICDALFNMSKILKRKRKGNIWFTQQIRDNINKLFGLLDKAFEKMGQNLEGDYEMVDQERALAIEKSINKYRKELHKEHIENVEGHNYKHDAGVMYNDLFNRCERLGDYIYNVSKMMGEIGN